MKAYPTSQSERYPEIIQGGMDLRDYFAGQVLQGLFASESNVRVASDVMPIITKVKMAYIAADKMMEARNAK